MRNRTKLSNSTIFIDLEQSLTQILRSYHYFGAEYLRNVTMEY